jgi:hypothetical protein
MLKQLKKIEDKIKGEERGEQNGEGRVRQKRGEKNKKEKG